MALLLGFFGYEEVKKDQTVQCHIDTKYFQ